MLESFKEEIPNIGTLIGTVTDMLQDYSTELEDVREAIFDHIMEHSESEFNTENSKKALNVAFTAIDDIFLELQENARNCDRLKKYIDTVDSYNAYNRLIMDFQNFMSTKERHDLIARGKTIFIPEITEHWI